MEYIVFFFRNVIKIKRIEQLGPHLPCRTFGDKKEFQKFSVTTTLITLGNVGRHRNGRALNLISQSKVLAEISPSRYPVHITNKLPSLLPHDQILKIPSFHLITPSSIELLIS